MAWVAVGVGVAGLALSAGESAYAASNQPQEPNLSADSAEMANVQASLLPQEAALQKEAELGQSTLNQGYTESTQGAQQQQQIQQQINLLQKQLQPDQNNHAGQNVQVSPQQAATINSQITNLRGQLANIQPGQPVYLNSQGQVVPASQATTSFAGNSTADIQQQLMTQAIQGQLANSAQYDPQFIANQLAEEQQANPQGVAARSDLYNQIQSQIANPPTSPVADTMNSQVQEHVNAGSGLTPEEQAALDSQVGAQGSNDPNFSTQLTTGFGGQARAAQNAGEGASWLSSGQTPGDIQYRAEQQNLGNLSSYISGQTPESQFSELSGSQNTATPQYQNTPQPTFNFGAAQQGAQAGLTNYGQQTQANENALNPWSTGITGVLGAANAAAAGGFTL